MRATNSGCKNLERISFGTGLVSINENAFYDCKLIELHLPKNLKHIDENAFYSSSPIYRLSVDVENPMFDSREGCNAVINTATNTLVMGCTNTTIPQDVVAIGNKAFKGRNNLHKLIIPEGIQNIGENAFEGCDSLNNIVCLAPIPPTCEANTFSNIYKHCILQVPEEYIETYKSTMYWRSFFNIISTDINIFKYNNDKIQRILYGTNGILQRMPNKGINIIRKDNNRYIKTLTK